jgi:hypothetical protein
MQLRAGEKVIRVFYHHYMPFIYRMVKVVLGSLPFFFIAYLFSPIMSMGTLYLVNIALIVFFILVVVYVSLIYWMDRVIITNQRVIYIDWKTLVLKNEVATNLEDVQDIFSKERGIISAIPCFNYGELRIQTASHIVAVVFEEAPNADGIKDFIYNVRGQVVTK